MEWVKGWNAIAAAGIRQKRQKHPIRIHSFNSWLISPAADTRISGMKGRGIVRERRR